MLKLETDLQGKRALYGEIEPLLRSHGFSLCGNWEYNEGMFDGILNRMSGETIYLRLPFDVLSGSLDHPNTMLAFGQPFLIKHVVNVGLDHDQNALLTTTGFDQFQAPLEKDANIQKKSQWEERGEEKVADMFGNYEFIH
ncbi:YugN family protein [Edaphobacillus lindanitolerans]|uniref:YugN-like family protein n=1 Tax=Edaphobacillus lindanitolerans TaxID=550447 RepID=A0A1U7PK93_9BACI|nr:YugN family protein [Edaphobacillus lindanitolerans]SIT84311.1 YugN-like family protein [Edaphobacillus lindanitolerans]